MEVDEEEEEQRVPSTAAIAVVVRRLAVAALHRAREQADRNRRSVSCLRPSCSSTCVAGRLAFAWKRRSNRSLPGAPSPHYVRCSSRDAYLLPQACRVCCLTRALVLSPRLFTYYCSRPEPSHRSLLSPTYFLTHSLPFWKRLKAGAVSRPPRASLPLGLHADRPTRGPSPSAGANSL